MLILVMLSHVDKIYCLIFALSLFPLTIHAWISWDTTLQYDVGDKLFETSAVWNECNDGYVIGGLEKGSCPFIQSTPYLGCINSIHCVAPSFSGSTLLSQTCYDHDISSEFDLEATVQCNNGYFVRGIFSSDNSCTGFLCVGECGLDCLETLRCCKYDDTKVSASTSGDLYDWMGCFEGTNSGMCNVENDQYITGFYRTDGSYVSSLEQAVYGHLDFTPQPTHKPTILSTIPSQNPSSNPSFSQSTSSTEYTIDDPTESPTHDVIELSLDTIYTTYTVTIDIEACGEPDAYCDVNITNLNHGILETLSANTVHIKIMSSQIIDDEVVIRLLIETNADNALDTDIIRHNIEREVRDDAAFGDVNVNREEAPRGDMEPNSNDNFVYTVFICTGIVFICTVSIYLLIYCSRKQRVKKDIENAAAVQMHPPNVAHPLGIQQPGERMGEVDVNEANEARLHWKVQSTDQKDEIGGEKDDENLSQTSKQTNGTILMEGRNDIDHMNIASDEFVIQGDDEMVDTIN